MIGAGATQPACDLIDPPVEIVNQLETRLDVTTPWLGEIQLGEQLAAGDAEQVGHRDLVAEGDQRCVDSVLEDRAVLDQVQPPPGALPLGAQLRRRQPDRRHEIPEGELREHARVDLVGLHANGASP